MIAKWALRSVGQAVRRVVVEDPDGRAMNLTFPRATPTLILYEDRIKLLALLRQELG